MSIIGSPHAWVDLLEKMLPEILRLTLDAWNNLTKPFEDDKEDSITTLLCKALRRNRTFRDLPLYVEIQLVELDPAPEQELGRLDIAFRPTGLPGAPNEAIYFCLECKRLNVVKNGKTRSRGSEYVMNGMIRFVSGQYSSAVRHGGMLGYVLDGKVHRAIVNVEANIVNQCEKLGMEPPGSLSPSTIITELTTAKLSMHRRAHGPTPFAIHHLFVDAQAQST